jgi:radical SAM superfamily enzyme YgiQ (UPF0313 family)
VGYISSILKQAGHSVDVLDINCVRLTKIEVERYISISASRYDYFGISGIITTYDYQKWLIETIRKYSSKSIVCGGGCATTVGKLLLKAGATEIIKGEGENPLLKYIGSTLAYNNIDEIPSPDWSSFNMEEYLANPIWGKASGNASNVGIHKDMENIKRSVNVITSRGCPYSCNFCYDLFGRGYRQRSVDNVIKELKLLKSEYNVDFVGFVDDNMMVNKKWIFEFCEKMSDLDSLWGCHARVNEVNKEVLEAVYKAGCRWIGYGIESGSQSILNLMNKKVNVDASKRALFATKQAGIYPNTSFIYGYPGESKKTVKETICFCKETEIKPNFFFATPYPGSKLYADNELKILEKTQGFENFVSKLGEAKDFVINLTDMSDDKFFKLKNYLEEKVNEGC